MDSVEVVYKIQDIKNKLKYFSFYLLDRLISPFYSTSVPEGVPVIVILKPLGIGDLVMLSPLIEMIKNRFEHFMVLSDLPCIFVDLEEHWISAYEIRNLKHKTFFVFPSPSLSNLQILLKYPRPYVGNLLRYSADLKVFNFNELSDHYFDRTKAILSNLKISQSANLKYLRLKGQETDIEGRYMCISPFCNWETRRTPQRKFLAFVKRTSEQFEQIIIVGSANIEEVAYNKNFEIQLLQNGFKVQNLTGKTNLQQLASIIQKAEVYIGNDSGPTHFAMISAKNVHIFDGCIPAELRVPLNNSLTKKIKSHGKSQFCKAYPCYSGLSEPQCKVQPNYQCMEINEDEFN